MKKNQALTDATRRAIREAFWSLYQEKPVSQITVREISERAGYNRSTFYQYYKDVYDVLEQIETHVLRRMKEYTDFIRTQAQEMPLTDVVSTFIGHQKQEVHYLRGLLGEHGDRAFEQKLVEWGKTVFGTLFLCDNIDPVLRDWLLEYNVCGIVGVMKYVSRQGQEISGEQLINLLATVFKQPAVDLSQAPLSSLMKFPKQLKTVDKPVIIEENSF